MLKAIAVDDELAALKWLNEVVKQTDKIKMLGSFLKSQEAIAFLKENEVDIVFLDIEMPIINGLELSESIFELKPAIDVIFITAYDKYALEAFKTHAIGYLLKPVDQEDIIRQTDAILKKRTARLEESASSGLDVICLGKFLCVPGGSKNKALQWRTAKAEELFALLVHNQGEVVSRERILDALWPDMELGKSTKNLYATWYYIRDMLRENGFGDILSRSRCGYKIKVQDIWCDMLEFVKNIEALKTNSGGTHRGLLEKTEQLYNGTYLGDRSYEWSGNLRVWIDGEYEKLIYSLAMDYRSSNEFDKEREVLKRLIYFNPYADEAYRLLIALSLRQNDYATARGYYKKYEKLLSDELGISTPSHIMQMMKNFI